MSGIKPPYKVPSMAEIKQIPWNGYNVVSTFSGGGGSCLGYRMAGYHVLYANEFVEEAQKTYRANHEDTYLDCRDIRTVKPEEILEITGLKKGEIDLFDGSPPCCAFSTAGKREKSWGKQRAYSDGKTQRIEDLFLEYIRLLNGLQPKVFVAENVSGMVKGTAIGYFKEYLRKMKECGYNVKAELLNAKWLGVPQNRERIIFCGVRKDLDMPPVFPTPETHLVSIEEALQGVEIDAEERQMLLNSAREASWYKIAKEFPIDPDKYVSGPDILGVRKAFQLQRWPRSGPVGTFCQQDKNMGTFGTVHYAEVRRYTINEVKRLSSVPDDFKLTGDYSQQYERLARMVPPVMMMHVAKIIQREVLDKCKIR